MLHRMPTVRERGSNRGSQSQAARHDGHEFGPHFVSKFWTLSAAFIVMFWWILCWSIMQGAYRISDRLDVLSAGHSQKIEKIEKTIQEYNPKESVGIIGE